MRLDKLYELDVLQFKDAALAAMTVWQRFQPEYLVAAAATLFLYVCAHVRLDPRRVLEASERVLRGAKEKHPVEFRALATYLREEVKL